MFLRDRAKFQRLGGHIRAEAVLKWQVSRVYR